MSFQRSPLAKLVHSNIPDRQSSSWQSSKHSCTSVDVILPFIHSCGIRLHTLLDTRVRLPIASALGRMGKSGYIGKTFVRVFPIFILRVNM